jgi:two-component system OmpR family response regulator
MSLPPRTKVLFVEDEASISGPFSKALAREGFEPVVAATAARALELADQIEPDIVLLDLTLPDGDGRDVCRALRRRSNVPIVMLTARGTETDRIVGLEIGADDYLAKPFNPRELLARIRAILRRGATTEAAGDDGARRLCFLDWTLDVSLRQLLSPEEARITITGAEFDLLHALCLRPGRVLSRDQLLDLTQGRAAGPFERSIDVLISRIRQKIEADPRNPEIIRTIRSGGYLFTPAVTRS